MKCTTGRITVCPCNTALYDVQSLTCEAELFFQNTGNYIPCRRRLFYRYKTPLLQRHGSTWVYHLPTQRQVTIRCPNGNGWKVYNEVLSEAGIIHNATECSITSNKLRTRPELHGSTYTMLATPSLYLPEVSPMLAGHEEPQLQEAFPTEAGEIDKLRAQLQTPQRSYDLYTLLQLRQTPRLRESLPYWHLIVIRVSCTITVILVLYCSLRARFQHLLLCNATSDTNPAPQNFSTPIPVSRHIEESHPEEFPKEVVSFTTYAMPQEL